MMVEDSRSVLRAGFPDEPDPYRTGAYDTDACNTVLTAAENARAAALAGADRTDYVAAHLLVRICAAHLAQVPPWSLVIEQRCPGCDGTDHGKPFVRGHPGLSVSLSHTGGTVAVAAGWSAVGVDVEATAGFVHDRRLAARILPPAQAAAVAAAADPALALLRHWVRREAWVKAGNGSLFGPATPGPDPDPNADGRHVREWTAHDAGVATAVAAGVAEQPLTLLRMGTPAVLTF